MIVIGITGGSGSGKSTVATRLKELLGSRALFMQLDSYYRDNTHLSQEERDKLNYDHPDAIEYHLLIHHLKQLKNGQSVECPTYSYLTHCRMTGTETLKPSELLVIEGLLLLNHPKLVEFFDIIFYIKVPENVRLQRIIERDCASRGRDVEQIKLRFNNLVNPMHKLYIKSNMHKADYIIDNHNAANTLKQIHSIISDLLINRS